MLYLVIIWTPIPGLAPGFRNLTLSPTCINCAAMKSSSYINVPAFKLLVDSDSSNLSDEEDEWTDPFLILGECDFFPTGAYVPSGVYRSYNVGMSSVVPLL